MCLEHVTASNLAVSKRNETEKELRKRPAFAGLFLCLKEKEEALQTERFVFSGGDKSNVVEAYRPFVCSA